MALLMPPASRAEGKLLSPSGSHGWLAVGHMMPPASRANTAPGQQPALRALPRAPPRIFSAPRAECGQHLGVRWLDTALAFRVPIRHHAIIGSSVPPRNNASDAGRLSARRRRAPRPFQGGVEPPYSQVLRTVMGAFRGLLLHLTPGWRPRIFTPILGWTRTAPEFRGPRSLGDYHESHALSAENRIGYFDARGHRRRS